MRPESLGSLCGVALLALTTVPANAEMRWVKSILTAQKDGAPTDGIIAIVNDRPGPLDTLGHGSGKIPFDAAAVARLAER